MIVAPWPEAYLTAPLERLGPQPCWALARRILWERGRVALPMHGPMDDAATAAAIDAAKGDPAWRRVECGAERALDLVVIARPRGGLLLPIHIGVVTETGMLIHAEEDRGVEHVAFRDMPGRRAAKHIKPFVDSLWRHRDLETE